MSIHFKERFIRMLHPYVMVLRQGGIKTDDLFDFSLALLHRDSGEVLPAPKDPILEVQPQAPHNLKPLRQRKAPARSRKKTQVADEKN